MGERPPTVVVRVTPRAAATVVGPWHDGVLEVRVTRPPAAGQATRAARLALAEALSVAPTVVTLVSGERSRVKRFAVSGLTAAELSARLARLGPGRG